MNQCFLVGKVKTLPIIKETNSGNRLGQFTIEVLRPYKNAQGENDSDTFMVNLWNGMAEECLKSIKEDQLVAIRCRLQANNYEREDETYYRSELVGEKLSILD